MKKFLFGMISVGLMASVLCGCEKEDISMKAADIEKQSIVVFDDGKVQASLIEEFKEDYYDVEELEEFMKENIETYNTANGTSVELSSIELNKSNVIAIFDFADVDEFAQYCTADTTYREEVATEEAISVKFLTGKKAKKDDLVPDEINKYGKKKTKKTSKAIKDDYKVFIIDNTNGAIQDDLDITVDGEIKFTTNVSKVDDNTCSISGLDGVAVVVFEP